MNDQTTFFIGFVALFGLITWYLMRLDRQARALEDRLALLEASCDETAENPKSQEREDGA